MSSPRTIETTCSDLSSVSKNGKIAAAAEAQSPPAAKQWNASELRLAKLILGAF